MWFIILQLQQRTTIRLIFLTLFGVSSSITDCPLISNEHSVKVSEETGEEAE